jgi:hypothetical protein
MTAFQKPDGCEEAVYPLPGQTKPFHCNERPSNWIGWPLRKEGLIVCARNTHFIA